MSSAGFTCVILAAVVVTAEGGSTLVVKNGCSETMWIAHSGNVAGPANVKIDYQQSASFPIPDGGLPATRFWPKMGCNAQGQECQVGNSGGPGQDCGTVGCSPAIDSKFEATFGNGALPCDTSKGETKGCDFWDTSAVDGFTLPYTVEVSSNCGTDTNIDCSTLTFSDCPSAEVIGNGIAPQDLHLKHPTSGKTVGCFSPCSKLVFPQWANPTGTHPPQDPVAAPFCCPTPPVSPAQCHAGPVAKSQFVQSIHNHCKHVYGYAYDDVVGTHVCPSGTTYTWTLLCPANAGSQSEFLI